MVVGLPGNESAYSNRLILVYPKPENGVRIQAKLGSKNPTGLPVGVVRFGEDGTLYKADSYIDLLVPDESIGHMADKQSDWLDEYMDAIEKMEE